MKNTRFIHIASGLDVVVVDDLAGFYAIVPALPGCGSQGDSVAETLENVDDAISIVLQVMGEDDPKGMLAIRSSTTGNYENGSNADSTAGNVRIAA